MTKKEFAKYLVRDADSCWHCGVSNDTLVPQHRVNRGMGGSKAPRLNNPSNIITFCSWANGLLESSPEFAEHARAMGWKLDSWNNPLQEPVFFAANGTWWLLNDDFTRTRFFMI
jgi:hypothetical protein